MLITTLLPPLHSWMGLKHFEHTAGSRAVGEPPRHRARGGHDAGGHLRRGAAGDDDLHASHCTNPPQSITQQWTLTRHPPLQLMRLELSQAAVLPESGGGLFDGVPVRVTLAPILSKRPLRLRQEDAPCPPPPPPPTLELRVPSLGDVFPFPPFSTPPTHHRRERGRLDFPTTPPTTHKHPAPPSPAARPSPRPSTCSPWAWRASGPSPSSGTRANGKPRRRTVPPRSRQDGRGRRAGPPSASASRRGRSGEMVNRQWCVCS